MMRSPARHGLATRSIAAGFTLVEVLVATALASMLMVALFRMLDTSLNMWGKGEQRRSVIERAAVTAELLATDLRALHNGQAGDLVCEWVPFDIDGDSVADRSWPRLRLVRQAGAGLMARHTGRAEPGLLEVAWAVVPSGKQRDARAEGVLMRGERALANTDGTSYFAPGFFDGGGMPRAGELADVSGGLLWLGLAFATQTSIVHDGWTIGYELPHASASWDAWNEGRPASTSHEWNEPGAGMPAVENNPLLPRRVRIELEFEREVDRKRRTRTLELIDATMTSFELENGDLLPRDGAHILLDGEWMRLNSKSAERAYVTRGQRGTDPVVHQPGAMVHHGVLMVTEVPIALYDDDWKLR